MIWIPATQDASASPAREATSPWLVDEFVQSYVCWREASADVKDAYDGWIGADGEDGALAFAAYRAALDREELAARAYSNCAARIAGRTR